MYAEEEVSLKPVERNTKRRPPQVNFGADGFIDGWAYQVSIAFRPALDIVFSERVKTITGPDGAKVKRRRQEWTEGDPPAFAFRETDCFCSREMVPGTQALNRFIAQVTQSSPDKIEQKRIQHGSVGFRFFEWQSAAQRGSYVELGFYICTQAAFVDFLRSGQLPEDKK